MKIEFLVDIKNLEQLKIEFRKFALLFHPDKGGDIEKFKILNNEFQYLIKNLTLYNDEQKSNKENIKNEAEDLEQFAEIINQIINLSDIEIEIIGKFIWLSGDTKKHKEKLKELKFKFAPNKMMWYWHNIKNYRSFGKKTDIEEIRNKYGTKKVQFNKMQKY